MSSVFYRSPRSRYPKAISSQGMYIVDEQGNRYLDMSGGAAVSCVGHGHPHVINAVCEQVTALAFAHTAFFTNEPQEKLADLLVQRFGDPGARVYFTSGGSEANETALKLCWQYWAALGRPQKQMIISRDHSYHGNTFGVLMVSGNGGRRRASAAPLIDWPRISPFYPYRGQADDESLQEYARRMADELEQVIEQQGSERIAAFICEPVVGSSLGVVAAEGGYLHHIRTICDRHEILLIADEIMCGSGRTGTFFAHQHDEVRPDIVTLAKGLAAGYQPLAATLVNSEVARVLTQSGFAHGHTYVGHPVACAAGLAVQRVLDSEGLIEKAAAKGEMLINLLNERFGSYRQVGQVRGRGLFIGIELVADRASKRGFENRQDLPDQLRNEAMQQGLICYPGGIVVDSLMVPHIMLAPPLIAEPQHLEDCVARLERVMQAVFTD